MRWWSKLAFVLGKWDTEIGISWVWLTFILLGCDHFLDWTIRVYILIIFSLALSSKRFIIILITIFLILEITIAIILIIVLILFQILFVFEFFLQLNYLIFQLPYIIFSFMDFLFIQHYHLIQYFNILIYLVNYLDMFMSLRLGFFFQILYPFY